MPSHLDFDESRKIQGHIQLEKQDGHDGGMGSAILEGHDDPGVGVKHPVSEMVPRRTKIYTRTDSLTRKYGSTGTGSYHDAGPMGKSYGAKHKRTREKRPKL